jgi:hypothetical protein
LAQMCHFLIVNTTQKSVDKAVEQRIMQRLTDALDVDDLPILPRWIARTVEKGEVDKALKLVDYLNETPGSPWQGKIQLANEDPRRGVINQRSFVKSIVKYVFNANNPLAALKDLDKEKRVFLNYWQAISNLLDDGEPSTLYKYNGVELFCRFSTPFFVRMMDRKSFTVTAMQEEMQAAFEAMDGEYAAVGHPEWWVVGGVAGMLNSGALNVVVQEMTAGLHKASLGTLEI